MSGEGLSDTAKAGVAALAKRSVVSRELSDLRRHVGVEAEQVHRIMFRLQGDQPREVAAVVVAVPGRSGVRSASFPAHNM